MFVLAHLSDLHLAAPPRLAELAGKRGLGFINWHRGRKNIHRVAALDALTADLKTLAVDHVAVTGDLVNLSLPNEYRRARAWLDALGTPSDVTVIPGNHDIYVPGALDGPSTFWGDYMRGDNGSGRPVGERLQCQERAHDSVRAMSGRPAFLGPLHPEFFGLIQRRQWIHRRRW